MIVLQRQRWPPAALPLRLVLLLVFLWLERGSCLAALSSSSSSSPSSPSPPSPSPPVPSSVRVISVHKNSGGTQVFQLNNDDNKSNNNNNNNNNKNHVDDPTVYSTTSASTDSTVKTNNVGSRSQNNYYYRRLHQRLSTMIRTTFLPVGYDSSSGGKTPPGYIQYCVWSGIQDLSTQFRSVLATQTVLEGVGVGTQGATALAALFNFLVRDGCGMAATLLFTYGAASQFRTDVKRWRLVADVAVDVGITLECLSTVLPSPALFLPAICLGNMCKAVCGVAAGACGGAIHLFWAGTKGNSISDISAKFGAQQTLTGALGLLGAGLFARSVSKVNPKTLWFWYAALTGLHIYANVRCMRLICFPYLNTSRMNMVLQQYLKNQNGAVSTTDDVSLPSPEEIAKREPLWFFLPMLRRRLHTSSNCSKTATVAPATTTCVSTSARLYFGISFDEFYRRSNKSVDELLRESIVGNATSSTDRYLISSTMGGGGGGGNCDVVVSFLQDATPLQETKAYFHANLLSQNLKEQQKATPVHNNADNACRRTEVETSTQMELEPVWQDFLGRCTQAGWDLKSSELQTMGFEIQEIDLAVLKKME